MKQYSWSLAMRAIVICLVLGSLAGCAAIFKGSTEDIELTSDPQGAKVYLNNQYVGVTPTYIRLKSENTYHFEFRKDGYKTRPVYLGTSVGAGWIILDVLCGLVGIIVDAATGSWYELDSGVVFAPLEPGGEPSGATLIERAASRVNRGSSTPAVAPVPTPQTDREATRPVEMRGPNIDVSLKDGTSASGTFLGKGDDHIRLEVYVPSKKEFREVVLQKSQINAVHDIVQDKDVTGDYK